MGLGADIVVTEATAFEDKHSRDSDAIVGDNGDIIRIVGINGVDVNYDGGTSANFDPNSPLYVSFEYDTYGGEKIIVRGIRLLDYTPGGPDFEPDLFDTNLDDGVDPGFRPMFGIGAEVDIGGDDEVHGETGDDFIYLGGGSDIAFGDADDDDIIGGWGHDWISGGTGIDGVLGDDGRIFTSRNSSDHGEDLFGVDELLARDPDARTSQGNVIDEFIFTPGKVQTETINVGGELKKSVDLTPFDLAPGNDDPLFVPAFADDVIFGGLGRDFLHGGGGDDAMGGGEALAGDELRPETEGYAPRIEGSEMDENGQERDLLGVVRSDFSRPHNPGNILLFGDDTNPWNAPKPVQSRLGEFYLYDEYDPRRPILFEDVNGKIEVWKGTDIADPALMQYFLNLVNDEGVGILGYVDFEPNGTPIGDQEVRRSDGADVIFGDYGNDWIIGGTGQDHLYGGWGNDLLNADDVLGTIDPHPAKGSPGQLPLNGFDESPDTHLSYEDRAYGGAGLDILIGNTGGDRLIDWVGEFNSFLVPFAPFGIATVSRQVPPHLFDFLWAQAAGDGTDITRLTDIGAQNSGSRYSNVAHFQAEPYGELGMVTQRDHGLWQDQTGGPTDPQAGNVPGGPRDVLRSADFNDGSMAAFAPDSGSWNVSQGSLSVAAESLGGDAASVFYVDNYLPNYFEISALIRTEKPTGGWKANAYVFFDYYSPTDFKFAGVDISNDKTRWGGGPRRVGSWTCKRRPNSSRTGTTTFSWR